MRTRISSNASWEDDVGYSRSVRIDDSVYVVGATATDEYGELVGVDEPVPQTGPGLANVERALEPVEYHRGPGSTIEDWHNHRRRRSSPLYLRDIDAWTAIGRAHRELRWNVRPACSMGQIVRPVDPDILVEMEAVATSEH
jgi:enamine deaminase RidA (YjgF/YER057c/UK114 family)